MLGKINKDDQEKDIYLVIAEISNDFSNRNNISNKGLSTNHKIDSEIFHSLFAMSKVTDRYHLCLKISIVRFNVLLRSTHIQMEEMILARNSSVLVANIDKNDWIRMRERAKIRFFLTKSNSICKKIKKRKRNPYFSLVAFHTDIFFA